MRLSSVVGTGAIELAVARAPRFLTAGARGHNTNLQGYRKFMPLQRNFLPAAPVGLALQLRHLAGIVRIVNLNACLSTFFGRNKARISILYYINNKNLCGRDGRTICGPYMCVIVIR